MNIRTLVPTNDAPRCRGKYVTKATFRSKRIISIHENPTEAFRLAKAMGIKDPVIFFVPDNPLMFPVISEPSHSQQLTSEDPGLAIKCKTCENPMSRILDHLRFWTPAE